MLLPIVVRQIYKIYPHLFMENQLSLSESSLGLEAGVDIGSLVIDDWQQEVGQVSADVSVGDVDASVSDLDSACEILVNLVHGMLFEQGLEDSEALVLPKGIVAA